MTGCHVFSATDLVGKKWTLVIIQEIALNKGTGFNFLLGRIGRITPKILSARLHELADSGFISKQENGARTTSYSITRKGTGLMRIFTSLKKWNETYNDAEGCSTRECATCPNFSS